MKRNTIYRWGPCLGLLGVLVIAPVRGQSSDPLLERFDGMVRYNLDNPHVVESARLEAALQLYAELPLGERIAAWAGWFRDLGGIEYVFGLDPEGYVRQGRLCQDFATDCVLFTYRVTELARSTTAEEAVQFAFGTRFYGASVEKAVASDGRVDYDDPAHLEYSEDMITSGIWGRDVTAELGVDLESAGEVQYLPSERIPYEALQPGDILWFVGEELVPPPDKSDGRVTRIHHIGFVDRGRGSVDLVHAAMKPLPGYHDKPGVVRVPLRDYLKHVERFRGVVVTRLTEF